MIERPKGACVQFQCGCDVECVESPNPDLGTILLCEAHTGIERPLRHWCLQPESAAAIDFECQVDLAGLIAGNYAPKHALRYCMCHFGAVQWRQPESRVTRQTALDFLRIHILQVQRSEEA